MKESDFLSFKRELWEIIRAEGIVVTNQNLDWLLEKAYKSYIKKVANDLINDLSASASKPRIDPKAITQKSGNH